MNKDFDELVSNWGNFTHFEDDLDKFDKKLIT